ncbi:Cna B-type domain-containing protein [Lactobacillus helveticus]|uniref:Cna B-type domain-containing protein n=4 Tax=Lactobacillus TaxID=1578 RepID=UPI00324B9318
MSNKSRHRRLLFMMGLVLFSLLGSIWISSNSGMTVYANTNITQNGTGSGTGINQQEEPQISTVKNTTDNTNSSDNQTSQKQGTNTEAHPRAPTEQATMSVNESTFDSGPSKQVSSVTDTINNTGNVTVLTTKSITGSRQKSLISRLSAKDDRDWGNQFITKAELQDKSGNPKTDFSIYDDMQAAWNFVIPANKAKSGDTMTVAIPSVLTLATTTDFDITEVGGTVIGRAAANPNTDKITITLTDAVKNNHNTITGSFKLWVHWNWNVDKIEKKEKNKPVLVNWGPSGSTNIHVEPSTVPDPNEVLYKWGWYDTNNPYIYWRVRINYAGKTINQAVYTDRVDDNLKLVSGSVSVYKVKYQSDGSNFNILSTYPSSSTIENGTSGFTTTLGDISSTVVIDYKTQITNNGISAHYKNNGKLAGSNIENKTVDVNSPDDGGNGNADTIITISGTKTWKDNNNQDGIRPSSITVNLLANGQQVASKKVSASDNWQYSFDSLAADANGQKITYTVTENAVAGYTSTVDGYNVTNNHTPATVKVSGTKTWKDNNNQDGIRPSSITVNLLANGQQVASKKVSASDNWQYSFDNLAADANGQKITYTVTENAVAGYTSTVDGYNVTNNHTPATVKVSGTKTWKDNNNQDGIRPSSITVNLLANGRQVASKKVSASDNWQYSFDNLAADANGQKITYTVTEDAVAGYTSTVDGYNVTNNHTPATVKVAGTKTWKDNNNQDGIRPSSITVNLLANGQQVASKKVSASDNWQYSFDNLPADANGKKITYTVTEDAVAGYTSTVADGYNVTNNHTPAIVKVAGTKTWKDNNNQDGIRPSSITVNLLANGQQVASKKVSASDNWQYSFDNLAADANGKKITYTVKEDAVAGYTSTVDGYNVTNNHTPATVKVAGTKTWKDNNNQDGIRPSSITVNLLANGQQVASKKVSASDNWQYSFDNLAADANGKKITYTVKEDAVAGYTSTVDGYNITNTHNPKPQVPNKPTTPKPQVPNKPTTPKPQVPNKPTTPKPQVPNKPTTPKPQVPNKPTTPKPQVPNNGNKVTPKAYTQGKTYEKTGKLPQTGDGSSMGMMLIGLVTLLLSLGLVVISRFTI